MSTTPAHIQLPPRYRVIRHVATGGMASVYAAEDGVLGRPVAVKVLAQALAADEAARGRFTREARAAARVSDHPNVVTIYDVGETDAEPPLAFIVMELLAGGTVADRLRSGEPIPHGLALRWLAQTAAALDAAHAADIVHRDVKPANLLLDANGVLKVGDFGIATLGAEAPLTLTGQVVGTAAYFAPEQAMGRPATPASDRYALSVVAFELLTGRRPFPEGAPAAQARAHVDSEPPLASQIAPGVPSAVDAVLARGLAKDPADRPPSAATLVQELESAIGPTAATDVANAPRFSRRPPPTPRRRAVAAAAPAATVGGDDVVRSSARSGRRAWPIALAALVLVLGIALAAILGSDGSDQPARKHRASTAPRTKTHARTTPKATTTAAAPAAAPATAPAAAPAGDPRATQQRAHALIDQGNYAPAIAMLRDVVGKCPVQTTDPCAYAWYDLGHALRLAGDPGGAIPVLQTRLQNPNQQGTVQQELELAQREAGGAPKDKAPKQGHKKD